MKNYSNLNEQQIWEMAEVKNELNKIQERLEADNITLKNDLYPLMINEWGFTPLQAEKIIKKKQISSNISLLKNCFDTISNDFKLLEFSIEFLHEVLNKCGYNRDKGSKVTSGIYDTTHSIYATYCDYFVTNDEKLKKRVKAIYHYLGVRTKVINFDEFTSMFVKKND